MFIKKFIFLIDNKAENQDDLKVRFIFVFNKILHYREKIFVYYKKFQCHNKRHIGSVLG